MRRFLRRLAAWLRPGDSDEQLSRETAAHLALIEEDYRRRGLTGADAHRAARLALGNTLQIREAHRDSRGFPSLDDLLADLRHGVRLLRRAPGHTVAAVLLMALGVGATTTLFSLVYGVLLKPLPWPDADRIVRLQEQRGDAPGRIPWTVSNATWHAWRERPQTIAEIGGWTRPTRMTITVGRGDPEQLQIGSITPGLLRVLGVAPLLGRPLVDADATGANDHALLLGYRVWQRRFGGRADIIGQTVRLDDRVLTVVGVMRQDFVFPDRETEAWRALTIAAVRPNPQVITAMIFNAMARLRSGVTVAQAESEATARARSAQSLGQAAVALFGSDAAARVIAVPAREAMTSDVRPALLIVFAAVALLFLSSVASLVVLQTARAARRQREMAVRAAIGAAAGRLVRQWVTETIVLAAGGAIAAMALTLALHRAMPALLPSDFPRSTEVQVDGWVMAVAVLLTGIVTVVCAIVPALLTRHPRLAAALAGDGPASGSAPPATQLRAMLMATQVGIACVLLIVSAILGRSVSRLIAADRGFDPRGVLTVLVSTPSMRPPAHALALDRIAERIVATAGVSSAGFGNALPFVTSGGFYGFSMPSLTHQGTEEQVQVLTRSVSAGYFPALGLRLVAGRVLERTDTASSKPVVVVNSTFARRYLAGRPIGRLLPLRIGTHPSWEVVGVVDDMRQGGLGGAPQPFGGVTDPPQPEIFFSHPQYEFDPRDHAFVVRTSGDPAGLAAPVRQIIHEEDPGLAVVSTLTMEQRVMESLSRPRIYAGLLAAFALFAVAIVAVGLFGVLSYMTTQRTREIGVRSALGAAPIDIVALIIRDAVRVTTAGVVLGVTAAWVSSRALATIVYGVSTHDAASFAAVPLVLWAVAALAAAAPVRRAARVNPLIALRHD